MQPVSDRQNAEVGTLANYPPVRSPSIASLLSGMAAAFGKTRLVDDLASDDFEALRADAAKIWGPHRLSKFVQCIRTLFKYGYDAGLLDKPVRYGAGVQASVRRTYSVRHRAAGARGCLRPQRFAICSTRRSMLLPHVQCGSMILLRLNCASAIPTVATYRCQPWTWNTGWINFPRPKTGIERRFRCGPRRSRR